MNRYLAILFFGIVAGALAGPPPQTASDADRKDYRDGSSAASADVAKGIIRYKIVGLPGPDAADLTHQAKSRYGITVIFHGCIPGPRVWHDQGYLDIVVERLIQKYGYDPVAKLDKELLEKRAPSR
jgi:hypothetical protein